MLPPTKRQRKSFTVLAQRDVVTLPLVFSFLDVFSLLKARRVCQAWMTGSRRPLAWTDTRLCINGEYVAGGFIPPSSVEQLRNLCLVRNLKAPPLDVSQLFNWLSRLKRLAHLRMEEIDLTTANVRLLVKNAPSLRSLDVKMSIEVPNRRPPSKTRTMMRPCSNSSQNMAPWVHHTWPIWMPIMC